MADSEEDQSVMSTAAAVMGFIWSQRKIIGELLQYVWNWRKPADGPIRQILIVGPGGVGKSTLGALLACDPKTKTAPTAEYVESLDVESHQLADAPGLQVVVLPGQEERRYSTWQEWEQAIVKGEVKGIIFVGSFGFHSLGKIDLHEHRLYKGDDEKFFEAYLQASLEEEIEVIERIASAIRTSSHPLWLLTVVTKQDLWWNDQSKVEAYYRSGAYGRLIEQLTKDSGRTRFRSELAFTSLIIGSYKTSSGKVLRPNSEGYDNQCQEQSVEEMLRMLIALTKWEDRQ